MAVTPHKLPRSCSECVCVCVWLKLSEGCCVFMMRRVQLLWTWSAKQFRGLHRHGQEPYFLFKNKRLMLWEFRVFIFEHCNTCPKRKKWIYVFFPLSCWMTFPLSRFFTWAVHRRLKEFSISSKAFLLNYEPQKKDKREGENTLFFLFLQIL